MINPASPHVLKDRLAALAPVVEALSNGLGNDLLAVVLFGSQARGEATPESDWDLLVIARNLPSKTLARHFALKVMLPEAWRGRISLLAKTPQEFGSCLPALYLDIALDGIVLFDPQEYITPRLEWIRRQIQLYRLERQRLGRDLMWHGTPFAWSPKWEAFT
jgi:predicted nucleotidyltransferase